MVKLSIQFIIFIFWFYLKPFYQLLLRINYRLIDYIMYRFIFLIKMNFKYFILICFHQVFLHIFYQQNHILNLNFINTFLQICLNYFISYIAYYFAKIQDFHINLVFINAQICLGFMAYYFFWFQGILFYFYNTYIFCYLFLSITC